MPLHQVVNVLVMLARLIDKRIQSSILNQAVQTGVNLRNLQRLHPLKVEVSQKLVQFKESQAGALEVRVESAPVAFHCLQVIAHLLRCFVFADSALFH